jgi:hypothetical protein
MFPYINLGIPKIVEKIITQKEKIGGNKLP